MISGNILHKTLDCSSIFLSEPIDLENPYCAKIIDYGDGELRKYKGFNDKNYDYITLFKSILNILYQLSRKNDNGYYHKIINQLIYGFKELHGMLDANNVSYNELIKRYILLLGTTFGKKYSEYASKKYK
jgi:hypothetical protein